MLTSLKIKNFTAFKDVDIRYGRGLNIVVGENGLGKSHLLKLPYAVLSSLKQPVGGAADSAPTKGYLQSAIADKLNGVFRPDSLGRLSKRKQGREKTNIELEMDEGASSVAFSFASNSKSEVEIGKMPLRWHEKNLIFLPTHELLTIYPGFVAVYDNYHLQFEETWRDTCLLLGSPLAKGAREKGIKDLLAPIEEVMDGKVVLDAGGRFYLESPGTGKIEMALIAEGMRKIAMIARLIAAGILNENSILFWDEPEVNLNPKLIRLVAKVIVDLASQGIQIHLATHSLFLMREIEILTFRDEYKEVDNRIMGVKKEGEEIILEQGTSFDALSTITSLEEELNQSDRFMEKADAG
jgi:predicted ATPase